MSALNAMSKNQTGSRDYVENTSLKVLPATTVSIPMISSQGMNKVIKQPVNTTASSECGLACV